MNKKYILSILCVMLCGLFIQSSNLEARHYSRPRVQVQFTNHFQQQPQQYVVQRTVIQQPVVMQPVVYYPQVYQPIPQPVYVTQTVPTYVEQVYTTPVYTRPANRFSMSWGFLFGL